MTTKIVSSQGKTISSLEDWSDLYRAAKKEKHWKEGRSAYSVADFILNHGGTAHLESRLSEVLRQETSISLIIPEKEVSFDGFRHGRVHDLGICATVGGDKHLFVGVEAKVNEKFSKEIRDELEAAEKELLKRPNSKKVQRVKALPTRFSPKLDVSAMLDIRYQLLHGTVGTVAARQRNGEPYDLYVFYVLVFKTSLYDEQKGAENHRDYQCFIGRAEGSSIAHPEVEAHSITIDDKPLTCIYEHVELPS